LSIRSLLERLFGFMQRLLAFGLGGSDRLELLTLFTESRLRLLFLARMKSSCRAVGSGAFFGRRVTQVLASALYRLLTAAGLLVARPCPTRLHAEGSGCGRAANRNRC